MFQPSQSTANNIEFLVRTALSNRELSYEAAADIQRYRTTLSLTADEQRYFSILEDAISDGTIQLLETSTVRGACLFSTNPYEF